LGEACEILKFATIQAQKRAASLKHPHVYLDLIEEGSVSGPIAGLLTERSASRFQESEMKA